MPRISDGARLYTLGTALISWRKARRMNQADFGAVFGVTSMGVSRWESGKGVIPAHVVAKVNVDRERITGIGQAWAVTDIQMTLDAIESRIAGAAILINSGCDAAWLGAYMQCCRREVAARYANEGPWQVMALDKLAALASSKAMHDAQRAVSGTRHGLLS